MAVDLISRLIRQVGHDVALDHIRIYFEGTGGSGRVGGGPGQGGRFCVDMLDSLLMMAIGMDFGLFGLVWFGLVGWLLEVDVDIDSIGRRWKAGVGGSRKW